MEGFVSLKSKLKNILLCLALGMCQLMGAPMSPKEIEELLQQMNQPKIAHTLPDENNKDGW